MINKKYYYSLQNIFLEVSGIAIVIIEFNNCNGIFVPYPVTTCFKNFVERSTTSSQIGETFASSKRVATGKTCKASKDSFSSSLHKSTSSPIHGK